ncbi:class I SAM-dependent methyltransferase [Magnetococcales bacterium HHB-1]
MKQRADEKRQNVKSDVQQWWSDNPQTYGDVHGETNYGDEQTQFGTKAFFERIDQEFYQWNPHLHKEQPFDQLFPYHNYKPGDRVLEIGCGMGTMAMNWAKQGVHLSAVDLSPTSIAQTRKRFELFDLQGDIHIEDGNHLSFEDHTFDYAYSWGVLHHSPDLHRSIHEMKRVLKPGGGFMVMLYHRHSLLHWYRNLYMEGFLHYEKRFLSPLALTSRYGDGDREEGNPHTWPVTRKEMQNLFGPFSRDLEIKISGTDINPIIYWMWPGFGQFIPIWARKPWARRFGWSVIMRGHRTS